MGHANLGLTLLRSGNGHAALGPLRRAAKRNDPSGYAGLSYAYYYGLGLKRDPARAAKAMAAAARLGHLDAIYNLGVMAIKGEGMPASVGKAYRFWNVAAEFQHPMAQVCSGGVRYGGGLGMKGGAIGVRGGVGW
jgi:TPR repeat protein